MRVCLCVEKEKTKEKEKSIERDGKRFVRLARAIGIEQAFDPIDWSKFSMNAIAFPFGAVVFAKESRPYIEERQLSSSITHTHNSLIGCLRRALIKFGVLTRLYVKRRAAALRLLCRSVRYCIARLY